MNMFSPVEVKKLAYKLKLIVQIYGFSDLTDFPENSYLSGSSAVKLLKGEKLDSFNDLDIYIQEGLSKPQSETFVKKLIDAGYLSNNKSGLKKAKMVEDMLSKDSQIEEVNMSKEHEYFSLKDHISKIISLQNKKKDMKIDIIIIKDGIENLLASTFDYDIVKNYIKINKCDNYVYVNNMDSINNKNAKMTKKHFENRIMDNAYEFNNFIRRFLKYKIKQSYNVEIGEVNLTLEIFLHIMNILMSNIEGVEFVMSKELLESGILANVIYNNTLYKINKLNSTGIPHLFSAVYSQFKNKKIVKEIMDVLFIDEIEIKPLKKKNLIQKIKTKLFPKSS
jgi:uncharacterized protein (UPF0335 family)